MPLLPVHPTVASLGWREKKKEVKILLHVIKSRKKKGGGREQQNCLALSVQGYFFPKAEAREFLKRNYF